MSPIVKRLLSAALLVSVMSGIGYVAESNSASSESMNRVEPSASDNGAHTFTVVSRESAEGYTEQAITVEMMSKLEAQTLASFRSNMGKEVEAMGKRWNPNDMRAESVIAEIGPRRLVVSRIKFQGVELAAQFFGILGGEVVRVACTTNKAGALLLNKGACNDKIKEVFGVSLNPVENGS